jgi:hypothetical protein
MNENQFLKSQTLSLVFYSQHVISTALRALARRIEGDRRANHGTMSSSALTDLLLPCSMKSLAHTAAITAVVVVADTTAARRLLLCFHHHRRLRPCHTAECWSGPRHLPLTGR